MAPADIAGTLQAGAAAHQAGNLAQAEQLYAQVLGAAPQQFDALHLLGVVRLQQQRLPEAIDLLRRAVQVNAQVPAAHFNLGLALAAAAQPAEALAAFDRAVAADPQAAEAWEGRGNALGQLGRLEEAIAAWRASLKIAPGSAANLAKIGGTLVALNRHGDALDDLARALDLAPALMPALRDYLDCTERLHRREEGLPVLDRAIAASPDNGELLTVRGLLLLQLNRVTEAAPSLEAALRLNPTCALLGETLRVRKLTCDWQDDDRLSRLSQKIAQGESVHPYTAMQLFFDDPDLELRNARNFVAHGFPALPEPICRAAPYRHDRIRLAYLAGDYRAHVVGEACVDLIERHDRETFEVTGLSFGPDDGSPLRKRLVAAFDAFHDVTAWTDAQVAQWLADNEIDIAVDLTGYCDYGRPEILALRGAPVQVSYLGFPVTRGAPYVDYILGDRFATPPESQDHYVEKIVTLPDCYLTGDSKRAAPLSAPLRRVAELPETGFVFCCFNQSFKITPEVFEIWLRLLKRVPASVLWLRCDLAVVQKRFRAKALARGLDPGRLIFAPRVSAPAHLARHGVADLFLDTPAYNAHTTAMDALWAGLPLLTCAGRTFVGRVASSVLRAAGLPELVTASLADYEALAFALATDPVRLAEIRDRVARARRESPLFDTDRTRRHIEAAYRTMVDIAQSGQAARPFTVAGEL